jgi:hypothetical protein
LNPKSALLFSAIALLALALFCSPAPAATIYLQSAPTQQDNGFYVGGVPTEYQNGTITTPITWYCDDAYNESYIGTGWPVTTETIAHLNGAMFAGDANAQTLYEEDAVLLLYEMEKDPSAAGPIQFAAWAIFDPAVLTAGYSDESSIQYWVNWVKGQNLGNYDFDGVTIYTPTGPGIGQQEGIGGSVTATPEPSTWWLVLAAVILLSPRVLRRCQPQPTST